MITVRCGKLLKRYSAIVQAKIWEDRIELINLETEDILESSTRLFYSVNEKLFTVVSVGELNSEEVDEGEVLDANPFSHPRTLLNDFFLAEKLLTTLLQKLLNVSTLSKSIALIIQPMEKIDGGLSKVEERAFYELGLSAKALDVRVVPAEQDVTFEGARCLFQHPDEIASGTPLDMHEINLRRVVISIMFIMVVLLGLQLVVSWGPW